MLPPAAVYRGQTRCCWPAPIPPCGVQIQSPPTACPSKCPNTALYSHAHSESRRFYPRFRVYQSHPVPKWRPNETISQPLHPYARHRILPNQCIRYPLAFDCEYSRGATPQSMICTTRSNPCICRPYRCAHDSADFPTRTPICPTSPHRLLVHPDAVRRK